MKTIFQVHFLLLTIGGLIVALSIQFYFPWCGGVIQSLGGPVEIARPALSFTGLLRLLVRFLTAGLAVPGAIGLLVCAVLRWRHPGYTVAVLRPVALSVLVWWAWGLLNVLLFKVGSCSYSFSEKQVFQWVSLLTSIGWVVAATRFSYYQERTSRQLKGKEDGSSPNSDFSKHTSE